MVLWYLGHACRRYLRRRCLHDATYRHTFRKLSCLHLFDHRIRYLKATIGIRVSSEEEAEGLDIGEHGQSLS